MPVPCRSCSSRTLLSPRRLPVTALGDCIRGVVVTFFAGAAASSRSVIGLKRLPPPSGDGGERLDACSAAGRRSVALPRTWLSSHVRVHTLPYRPPVAPTQWSCASSVVEDASAQAAHALQLAPRRVSVRCVWVRSLWLVTRFLSGRMTGNVFVRFFYLICRRGSGGSPPSSAVGRAPPRVAVADHAGVSPDARRPAGAPMGGRPRVGGHPSPPRRFPPARTPPAPCGRGGGGGAPRAARRTPRGRVGARGLARRRAGVSPLPHATTTAALSRDGVTGHAVPPSAAGAAVRARGGRATNPPRALSTRWVPARGASPWGVCQLRPPPGNRGGMRGGTPPSRRPAASHRRLRCCLLPRRRDGGLCRHTSGAAALSHGCRRRRCGRRTSECRREPRDGVPPHLCVRDRWRPLWAGGRAGGRHATPAGAPWVAVAGCGTYCSQSQEREEGLDGDLADDRMVAWPLRPRTGWWRRQQMSPRRGGVGNRGAAKRKGT